MYRQSARELHAHFTQGNATAEAITSYFLQRIEKYDPSIGAFLTIYKDRALEKARKLDLKRSQGSKLGKLAGIPIAIKDNIHVKGEITTCASKFLTNYRAVFDSTVTELLEKEDGIIIGKTNLDEFAMGSSNENSALKVTVNPWDLSCVPGGSSGGSAAAVAARLCPLSLGSDTGGSVRQPAGFCGIVGFKPTYGRISRYGLVAFASSLDQIGPLATTTEDIALAMEALGHPDPRDATSLPIHGEDYISRLDEGLQGKKIGIPTHFLQDLESGMKELFFQSLEVMKGLGCEIIDIDLNILNYSVATYYIIATAEASTNLARFDGIRYGVRTSADSLEEVYTLSRKNGFGTEVKRRILLGTYVLSSGYQDAYYKQAAKARVKIIEEFNKAFQKCDVIATPVSPIPAFQRGAIQDPIQMYLQDIYTIGVNLAYLPAITVPCGFNNTNKPFGLQLIGAKRDDTVVCQFSHSFERATSYTKRIPPLFDKE